MTVTINGSTGISGVDGSAATPALQGGDTNTGIYFPAADNIGFTTGGTIRGRWTTDGLCFNTDTAAVNALDDYEEGTWTPSFGNLTVSSSTATYTKIGRTVSLFIGCTPSDAGTWSAMNYFTITSLPFAPSGDAYGWASFSMGATQQAHFLGGGGTTMYFVCTATAAGVNKNISVPFRIIYNVA